jgi:DNA-binding transcriptional MerR regulator
MQIKELSNKTRVSPKTIRYYEEIGILPEPDRAANGYRKYKQTDIDRLKLVAGARRLEISLVEIKEILDMRDRNEAPCSKLIELLGHKKLEIEDRIKELTLMELEIQELYDLGLSYPTDDIKGKNCVCHLVSQSSQAG